MKAAVIGCGNVSVMHFNALRDNPDTEIIAVADIKPERADKKADRRIKSLRAGFDSSAQHSWVLSGCGRIVRLLKSMWKTGNLDTA